MTAPKPTAKVIAEMRDLFAKGVVLKRDFDRLLAVPEAAAEADRARAALDEWWHLDDKASLDRGSEIVAAQEDAMNNLRTALAAAVREVSR